MRKIALIGYGPWGQTLLPYLKKYFDVVSIFGRSIKRDGLFTNRLNEALADEAEAVIIATPISTHYSIAGAALLRGKHVFCEKPLAMTTKEANELVSLAAFRRLHLVTDYTYTFSKRLQETRENLTGGKLRSMTASMERNLKEKENVYWVLASHLVAILGMFTELDKLEFSIVNGSTERSGAVYFTNEIEGTFLVNMEAERRRMELCLYTDRRVLIFNDLPKDNNLGYAVEYFRDVLDGKEDESTNIKKALSVTAVLQGLWP